MTPRAIVILVVINLLIHGGLWGYYMYFVPEDVWLEGGNP